MHVFAPCYSLHNFLTVTVLEQYLSASGNVSCHVKMRNINSLLTAVSLALKFTLGKCKGQ